MITDEQIELAIQKSDYKLDSKHHEHNDCIRIAY